jgi:hypothetical protein
MRWTVRDVGVFLYGCLFAGRYVLFQRVAHQPREHDAKKPLAPFVPPLRLTTLKTLRSTR